MKKRSRKVFDVLNDAALVIPGLIAIVIASIDFLDLWEKFPVVSKERMLTLILLCCGLIIVGIVIERRMYLASIQETLEALSLDSVGVEVLDTLKSISFNPVGVEILGNPQALNAELERTIMQSNQSILVVGAKSRLSSYLNVIKESVLHRDVAYKRLIDGTYIPHELHEHLESLIGDQKVQIAWTPREKFGNFTVTDTQCVFAFPSANVAKYFGIRLGGQQYNTQMKDYFYESFRRAVPVENAKALKCLCEECSPQTARKVSKICIIIERERCKEP